MAQVDFSNAVLEPINNGTPLSQNNYLALYATSAQPKRFDDVNTLQSISYPSMTLQTNTPTKVSVLYTGYISSGSGGTSFYITANGNRQWQVSNISFNNGDTYSFVIDIEVSGNT